MPCQQSSFRGARTASTFHVAIAEMLAWSDGPSKMPHPWAHAYSVPERFTPCNRIGAPVPSTIRVPDTRSAGAASAAARTPAAGRAERGGGTAATTATAIAAATRMTLARAGRGPVVGTGASCHGSGVAGGDGYRAVVAPPERA